MLTEAFTDAGTIEPDLQQGLTIAVVSVWGFEFLEFRQHCPGCRLEACRFKVWAFRFTAPRRENMLIATAVRRKV